MENTHRQNQGSMEMVSNNVFPTENTEPAPRTDQLDEEIIMQQTFDVTMEVRID